MSATATHRFIPVTGIVEELSKENTRFRQKIRLPNDSIKNHINLIIRAGTGLEFQDQVRFPGTNDESGPGQGWVWPSQIDRITQNLQKEFFSANVLAI